MKIKTILVILGAIVAVLMAGQIQAEIQTNSLTIIIKGDGNVTAPPDGNNDGINCPPDCVGIYDDGADITVSAIPSSTSCFVMWSCLDCHSSTKPVITLEDVTEDVELTATFEFCGPVPTLSQSGIITLVLLMVGSVVWVLRRRKREI